MRTSAVRKIHEVTTTSTPSWSDLNEARYATPGTPENKAYHAKLDEISAMAETIRRNRESR